MQTWTEGVKSAKENAGAPLSWAGSSQYPGLDIQPGDRLFIVYLDENGYLNLIGRLLVSELIDRRKAVRRRGPEIWPASHYAFARRGEADRRVFDRPVPADIVRRLRFRQANGKLTALKADRGGAVNGQRLQRIRRLTTESEALLDSVRELEPDVETDSRPGRRRPPKPVRDAIEDRAMKVVADHYRERGWKVEDVHLKRSYDLLCSKGAAELHVEVKGKGGEATIVEVTRGEVEHARACKSRPVLAVVENIKVSGGSSAKASGGDGPWIYDRWEIRDRDLEPLRFNYAVPPPSRAKWGPSD